MSGNKDKAERACVSVCQGIRRGLQGSRQEGEEERQMDIEERDRWRERRRERDHNIREMAITAHCRII